MINKYREKNMKFNSIDCLVLVFVGALFVNASTDVYSTNWGGLIIGGLLMIPGLCTALRDL